MSRNEEPLKDVLKQFTNSRKIKNQFTQVMVEEVWNEQLGPAIKKYTEKVRFRSGIVTVTLTSAPLRQELSYGKEKLIQILNDGLGEPLVKDVKFY